mmetsp:Transcript_45200/g.119913  ORF Transcript_45200/g.119913 Transcript_45200/m.119913 type:complete len:272 (+) Transcript_45200:1309-2124(+)
MALLLTKSLSVVRVDNVSNVLASVVAPSVPISFSCKSTCTDVKCCRWRIDPNRDATLDAPMRFPCSCNSRACRLPMPWIAFAKLIAPRSWIRLSSSTILKLLRFCKWTRAPAKLDAPATVIPLRAKLRSNDFTIRRLLTASERHDTPSLPKLLPPRLTASCFRLRRLLTTLAREAAPTAVMPPLANSSSNTEGLFRLDSPSARDAHPLSPMLVLFSVTVTEANFFMSANIVQIDSEPTSVTLQFCASNLIETKSRIRHIAAQSAVIPVSSG